MTRFRQMVKVIGLLWAYSLAILLVCIMLIAYASPHHSVTILLDSFGEASAEFWSFWVVAPIMTVAVAYVLRQEGRQAPSATSDRAEPIPSDDK